MLQFPFAHSACIFIQSFTKRATIFKFVILAPQVLPRTWYKRRLLNHNCAPTVHIISQDSGIRWLFWLLSGTPVGLLCRASRVLIPFNKRESMLHPLQSWMPLSEGYFHWTVRWLNCNVAMLCVFATNSFVWRNPVACLCTQATNLNKMFAAMKGIQAFNPLQGAWRHFHDNPFFVRLVFHKKTRFDPKQAQTLWGDQLQPSLTSQSWLLHTHKQVLLLVSKRWSSPWGCKSRNQTLDTVYSLIETKRKNAHPVARRDVNHSLCFLCSQKWRREHACCSFKREMFCSAARRRNQMRYCAKRQKDGTIKPGTNSQRSFSFEPFSSQTCFSHFTLLFIITELWVPVGCACVVPQNHAHTGWEFLATFQRNNSKTTFLFHWE